MVRVDESLDSSILTILLTQMLHFLTMPNILELNKKCSSPIQILPKNVTLDLQVHLQSWKMVSCGILKFSQMISLVVFFLIRSFTKIYYQSPHSTMVQINIKTINVQILRKMSRNSYTSQHQSQALTILEEENTRLTKKLAQITKLYEMMLCQRQKYVGFEDSEAKRQIQQKVTQKMERKYAIKEKSLRTQFQIVKDRFNEVSENYDEIYERWQKLNTYCDQLKEQNEQLKERQQEIALKLQTIQKIYQEREKQILQNFNKKYDQIQQNCERQGQEKSEKIKKLQGKILQISKINNKTEDEYEKIKQLLESEMKKRKSKQEQYRIYIKSVEKQLRKIQESQNLLKERFALKIKENMEKDEIIQGLRKSVKNLQAKLAKITLETQKQLNREKSKTKKAFQGLEMMKKYSQFEISKSRKKEKAFKNSQKELILKIKQISTTKNDGSTAAKSSRKNSSKSLNTTLTTNLHPSSNRAKDSLYSPCVSNFILEEENTDIKDSHNSKEIEQNLVFQQQNGKSHLGQFLGNYENSKQIQYLKKLQPSSNIPYLCEGTPCFESERMAHNFFKASNK